MSRNDQDSEKRASGGPPVPGWLRDLAAAASKMEINPLAQPPAHGGRASAVLVLFAEQAEQAPGAGPDQVPGARQPAGPRC